MGKKGVLLCFVKAMNLIDEHDRARAEVAGLCGVGHDLLDFLDSAENGRKLDKVSLRNPRNDLRECRLSHSGRAPENDRSGIVAFNLQSQRLAGSKQVLLTNYFIERTRTHPFRQWGRGGSGRFPF